MSAYEKYTVDALKTLLRERNIPGRSYLTRKQDMVERLYQYDNETKSDHPEYDKLQSDQKSQMSTKVSNPNSTPIPSDTKLDVYSPTQSTSTPSQLDTETAPIIDAEFFLTIPEVKELEGLPMTVLHRYLDQLGMPASRASIDRKRLVKLVDIIRYVNLPVYRSPKLTEYVLNLISPKKVANLTYIVFEDLIDFAIAKVLTIANERKDLTIDQVIKTIITADGLNLTPSPDVVRRNMRVDYLVRYIGQRTPRGLAKPIAEFIENLMYTGFNPTLNYRIYCDKHIRPWQVYLVFSQ